MGTRLIVSVTKFKIEDEVTVAVTRFVAVVRR
jgi:hypothetical protein